MDAQGLQALIDFGESHDVEFKRCGNKVGNDVFETICSFANGFGGTILLGVEDDGSVRGLEKENLLPIRRNIVNALNNPALFDPPLPVEMEDVPHGETWVIRVWVPPSAAVHSFKGKIYERQEDADVAVRTAAQLAEISIRKQGIYTEQRVYRYVQIDDLRADVIAMARKRAAISRPDHPWAHLDDEGLLRSAGLLGKNYATNEEGLNLAAILLLGKDDVIRSICPSYETDAIVRLENDQRYDDRSTVRCNLVEAYDLLADFCRGRLPDRFHLEGLQARSPRDVIVRELVANCLVHREFTSPYPARITIDADGIRTENASRAPFQGRLDPSRLNPNPKNPLIASFFVQIGLAEKLGSGVRNLYDCSRAYTGFDPVLEEGPVFRAFVPITREGALNRGSRSPGSGNELADKVAPFDKDGLRGAILKLAAKNEGLGVSDLVDAGYARRSAQRSLSSLVAEGTIVPRGEGRSRRYYLFRKDDGPHT